jgi:phosphoglycolate phosphatase
MSNPRKLLLFDFDGVLVDSLPVYARAIQWTLAYIGMPIVQNETEYLELFDENFYASLEQRGVDMAAFTRGLEIYKQEIGGDYYGEVKPYPFMPPVLEALRRDHLLAVVSSNSSDAIERIFDRIAYKNCFAAILGADFAFSKRDKICFALERFRTSPRDAFYIGDTVGDIKEGRLAGVTTVAVTWGWHSKEKLQAAGPDLLVEEPEGLLTL